MNKIERRIIQAVDRWYILRHPDEAVLIGDEDRTKAVDYLALAHSLGYISLEDMRERAEMALTATHQHHLDWPLRNLPEDITPPEPPELPPVQQALADAVTRHQHRNSEEMSIRFMIFVPITAILVALLLFSIFILLT